MQILTKVFGIYTPVAIIILPYFFVSFMNLIIKNFIPNKIK